MKFTYLKCGVFAGENDGGDAWNSMWLIFIQRKSGAAEITGSTSWLKNFFPMGATDITAFSEALYGSIIFGSSTFVPPLWTLKIEFIGSLYLLLFYIAKPRKKILVPMALALLLVYAIHKAESMYYIAIFAGSLLNLMRLRGSLKPIMFVAGVYFGAFQFESAWYSFLPSWNLWGVEVWETKTLYNAIGAFLITATVVNGFVARVFESRVAQFLT